MKKIFLVFTVAAIALALTVPASAALKLTTKGEFTVDAYVVNNNVITNKGTNVGDASNAFYNMKMLVEPTLHINDKVRLHSRITIMERNWTGADIIANAGGDYRVANEFWVERLYVSFPLLGGTLYVGRMGGGQWAYPWQDNEDDRDRIKYARKFGHIVLVGLIEKIAEADGGVAVLNRAPALNGNFDQSYNDVNAYAIGAIIPFSKSVIWKPLFYYIDFQQTGFGNHGTDILLFNALTLKFGGFFLDTEIIGRWRNWDDTALVAGSMKDWDEIQWSGWGEVGFRTGPVEIALGGFYLEGTDSTFAHKSNSFWGVGSEFTPSLLLWSEDLGLFFDANNAVTGPDRTGVPNASSGRSGFISAYLRGAFKLNDAMTLSGVFLWVEADEMKKGSKWDGIGTADDELGCELNISFAWKFLPNMTYTITGAYLWTGDYFDDSINVGVAGQRNQANDVFGMHHGISVQW
jgi:hypothetical protein